jgi:hypothetical protein
VTAAAGPASVRVGGARRAGAGLLLFVSVLASGGCGSAIMHGPRVEPGPALATSWEIGLGPAALVAGGDAAADGEVTIFPTATVGGRFGAVTGDGGPAALVGLQLPVFGVMDSPASMAALDLYVQPVWSAAGGADWGVGTLIAPGKVQPYALYGRDGGGAGWYASGAFAHSRVASRYREAPPVRTALLLAGFSRYRDGAWNTRSHLRLEVGAGRSTHARPAPPTAAGARPWVDERRTAWRAGVGLTVEFR